MQGVLQSMIDGDSKRERERERETKEEKKLKMTDSDASLDESVQFGDASLWPLE